MSSRQCVICLLEESEDDSEWLTACPCLLWVHKDCILLWVHTYEYIYLSPANCPVCFFTYNILPERDFLVAFMEFADIRLYENICELLCYMWQLLVIELAFASFGMLALWQVYGREEAIAMVFSMKPRWACGLCCYFIPLSLMFISSIPWDDIVLGLLRRFSILDTISPKEEPNIVLEQEEMPYYQVLGGAILLPTSAKAVGSLLFTHEPSKLRAFLFGCTVFVTLKAVFSMYYKKLYRRHKILTVGNYIEPETPVNLRYRY